MPHTPGALDDLVVREGGRVRDVVVGGRVVVENGCLATGDMKAIESTARREANRLWQRMAEIAASEA